MLLTQEYLIKQSRFARNGELEPLIALRADLDIKVTEHPSEPLVILNYGLKTPKLDPIGRECRSLCLNTADWSIVAKGFTRFLNLGESDPEDKLFNYDSFSCNEKVDGSLILLYYWGRWRINSRSTFGDGKVELCDMTWEQLFFENFPGDLTKLNPALTYVFELCSPYNQVVKWYPKTEIILLACFDKFGNEICDLPNLPKPPTYTFSCIIDCVSYLVNKDKEFEGFVIRDNKGNRLKIKNKNYLIAHHFKTGTWGRDRILEFLMLPQAEQEEFMAYYPAFKPKLTKIKEEAAQKLAFLSQIYYNSKGIESQKEFALSIKDVPMKGILFNCRKTGKSPVDYIQTIYESLL